jgi:MoxR-like ATPase
MLRAACQNCTELIEFPLELANTTIECPICKNPTVLGNGSPAPIRIPKFKNTPAWAREKKATPTSQLAERLVTNIEKLVCGKREQILLSLTALFSEGHLLLEDVPGVAKTMLARAIARSLDCTFKRLQCTPDLLPSDITGSSIFNPKTAEFEFRAGPLFAQIVLADEINRATPRAQSALLEAMSEFQVSADGTIYTLQRPFFLIATQNPIDHEGTFPLPEAQLDRFIFKLSLGYPDRSAEREMLLRFRENNPLEEIGPVASANELLEAQAAVRKTYVDPKVSEYVLAIVGATRSHPAVRLGASPRSTLALLRAAQSYTAIQGHDSVYPDDVKAVALPLLGHRLILRPESRLRKQSTAEVLTEILNEVEVPALEPKEAGRT